MSEEKEKQKVDPSKDVKKLEKELRSYYEGKTMVLIATDRLVWATGQGTAGFSVSHMSSGIEKGISPNAKRKVKNTVSLNTLVQIDNAVKEGILKMDKDLTDGDKDRIGNLEVIELNDEGTVKDMELIDTLLHIPVAPLEKELERLEKKNTSKTFFESLLKEEETGKKRSAYIKAIKNYL